jgi:hypothetical protein
MVTVLRDLEQLKSYKKRRLRASNPLVKKELYVTSGHAKYALIVSNLSNNTS